MDIQIALEYCTDTLTLKDKIEESFLLLGQRLKKIRDEELYKGQYETFPNFLEELKVSESVASRLISVYQRFMVEYGLSQEKVLRVGWSDAYQIMKATDNKEEAEEWVEKGQVLSSGDLRKELTEKRTGKDMRTCEHEFYTLRVCRKCQTKEKVFDDNE